MSASQSAQVVFEDISDTEDEFVIELNPSQSADKKEDVKENKEETNRSVTLSEVIKTVIKELREVCAYGDTDSVNFTFPQIKNNTETEEEKKRKEIENLVILGLDKDFASEVVNSSQKEEDNQKKGQKKNREEDDNVTLICRFKGKVETLSLPRKELAAIKKSDYFKAFTNGTYFPSEKLEFEFHPLAFRCVLEHLTSDLLVSPPAQLKEEVLRCAKFLHDHELVRSVSTEVSDLYSLSGEDTQLREQETDLRKLFKEIERTKGKEEDEKPEEKLNKELRKRLEGYDQSNVCDSWQDIKTKIRLILKEIGKEEKTEEENEKLQEKLKHELLEMDQTLKIDWNLKKNLEEGYQNDLSMIKKLIIENKGGEVKFPQEIPYSVYKSLGCLHFDKLEDQICGERQIKGSFYCSDHLKLYEIKFHRERSIRFESRLSEHDGGKTL